MYKHEPNASWIKHSVQYFPNIRKVCHIRLINRIPEADNDGAIRMSFRHDRIVGS